MLVKDTVRRIAAVVGWRVDAATSRVARHTRQAGLKLDRADILDALKSFGVFRSSILFVHSSLSACGYIRGGPATVVQALRRWIADRALAMPTHTYCYPERTGIVAVFEVQSTRSLVGAITDYFWRQPEVVRSIHPTHSLASSGPGSDELCRGHEFCNTPCGTGTPYARLVEQDCSVLMFGATMNTYTLFHTAEDAAQVPYLYEPKPYTLWTREQNGEVKPVVMWRQDMDVPRRFVSMDTWLEKRGLLLRRKLGQSELLFIPHAGYLHRTLVQELRRDPLFLVGESARTDVAKRFGL